MGTDHAGKPCVSGKVYDDAPEVCRSDVCPHGAQTVCALMVGGGVHDEDGVRGESVSATTTTGQRRAYMRTAGAANTTTATLAGTMGQLDGSTAHCSYLARSREAFKFGTCGYLQQLGKA